MNANQGIQTMFYLARINAPGSEDPLPNYGPFKQSLLAAQLAKKVAKEINAKVLPRRVSQAANWRERWQQRMATLKPLPPEWDVPAIPDHFAHLSSTNWMLISFVESAAHAVIGKLTEMKPGRYLKKYYPHLPAEKVKQLCGLIDDGNPLRIASTEEEIEAVYEAPGAPKSCMRRDWSGRTRDGDFFSPIHPARVYAAGDLSLAWMRSESGAVQERCLIWPQKKLYGRVYSDGSGRIVKALRDMGYVCAFKSGNGFAGARLKRHLFEANGTDYFVCPHVDAGDSDGSGATKVRDNGENLIIDPHGTMKANSTSGAIQAVVFSDVRLAA
jgi:hypothetical protein